MTHTLTDAQQRHVRGLIQQINTIQGTLQAFLNYVIDEANLPKIPQGYSLNSDATLIEPNAEPEQRQRIVLPVEPETGDQSK